jgi:nucleoside-diphosphate-sugar epimerase
MRVFIAGASGAIGTRLVPRLVERGHEVVGTYHSPGKDEGLRALGAEPVALDLLDREAVLAAVRAARPDAVVHEATALANQTFSRNFDRTFAATNRLRTEGTDALLAAAWDVGVRRVVAQSFASYRYARAGGPVKTEDDPLDPDPPRSMRNGFAALRHLEEAVAAVNGIVLRYGGFYGDPDDGMLDPVRKGRFPIVGDGGGMTSFVHLDDAASATVLAIEGAEPGIYNVCDDEPAPAREWLPFMAETLGARPPRRIPAFVARILAGGAAVLIGTEARAASNAKARRELGWELRYPSWRQGFPAVYGAPARDAAPVATARPHPSR